jgi:drug/metabolite transporter (DMT)-like permease
VHLSTNGVLLACASGAVASGVGYAIWYSVLRGLTATRAATVQLSVPVIAALGGVIFLFEAITTRLVVSTVLILGGVGVAVTAR